MPIRIYNTACAEVEDFFFFYSMVRIRIHFSRRDPDPHWQKMLDPYPDLHWNQCGSATLFLLFTNVDDYCGAGCVTRCSGGALCACPESPLTTPTWKPRGATRPPGCPPLTPVSHFVVLSSDLPCSFMFFLYNSQWKRLVTIFTFEKHHRTAPKAVRLIIATIIKKSKDYWGFILELQLAIGWQLREWLWRPILSYDSKWPVSTQR